MSQTESYASNLGSDFGSANDTVGIVDLGPATVSRSLTELEKYYTFQAYDDAGKMVEVLRLSADGFSL